MTSVASLLAWVYGLGKFSTWFALVSLPGMAALAAIGVLVSKQRTMPTVRTALTVGTIAGIVGTLGYDLFRVPFVFGAGLQLLRPIESYGVLALDATTSTGLTDLAGWAYHFSNGIGFGIVYAVVGCGRSKWWGVAWALVLETGTVLTPFASAYSLTGKWDIIGIAYAAHVPFGLAVGIAAERADAWTAYLRQISARTTTYALVVLGAVLVVWLRPLGERPLDEAGRDLSALPSAVILEDQFHPVWLRVAPGGCIALRNDDDIAYDVSGTLIQPELSATVCFEDEGVQRVRTSGEPYDGGFVIVDGALSP